MRALAEHLTSKKRTSERRMMSREAGVVQAEEHLKNIDRRIRTLMRSNQRGRDATRLREGPTEEMTTNAIDKRESIVMGERKEEDHLLIIASNHQLQFRHQRKGGRRRLNRSNQSNQRSDENVLDNQSDQRGEM